MRPVSARSLLAQPLLALVALALVACGSTVQEDSELTVYASVPLRGPDAAAGRRLAAGIERALERAGGEAGSVPIRLEVLDDTASPERGGPPVWTQAQVAANAREAAEDSSSIAYIGEAESDATRVSAPITNEAGIAHIAPAPVAVELLSEPGGNDVPEEFQPSGERTLVAFSIDGRTFGPGEARRTGEEAMALALDAIDRASDPLSRASVNEALFETQGRTSPLGTYTIGPRGLAGFRGDDGGS
jgi:hypothetical protein